MMLDSKTESVTQLSCDSITQGIFRKAAADRFSSILPTALPIII